MEPRPTDRRLRSSATRSSNHFAEDKIIPVVRLLGSGGLGSD